MAKLEQEERKDLLVERVMVDLLALPDPLATLDPL